MLVCVSANHQVTPLETLETLSEGNEDFAQTLVQARREIAGAVVVATCNRFEAYLDLAPGSDSEAARALVLDEFARRSGFPADSLDAAIELHAGSAAVSHLFAVASGLESVAIGETEITGQVRDALDAARENGTTTSDLERAFQQASQTSREVRAATGLEHIGRSLAALALDLAETRLSSWDEARVVLVGTGRFARVAVADMRRRGAVNIAVHSPSGRAAAFAVPRGLAVIDPAEASARIAAADLVVACSGAGQVIGAAELRAARAGASGELLLVDLGLPRNVDPEVAGLEDVTVLDLETVRLHAPLDEFAASTDARSLVSEATRDFEDETRELDAVPAISALHRHVARMLDAEISRSKWRGEDSEVAQALRHFAGVLLHEPTVRARALAREGRAAEFRDALETVFEVEVDAAAPRAAGPRSIAG